MKEFIEELKHNQNINLEKGLENRINIDYVIERLESIEDKDILKMYDLVFQDMVECYLENMEEEDKIKISKETIKEIAYKMIYKNEYLWEVVNDTINIYLEDYIDEED